jgi:hypothetical protein
MFSIGGEPQSTQLTLYTDVHVVRGTHLTRQRRVTDMLNAAEHQFLVLSDVLLEEFGSTSLPTRSEFAQINLASVLFAVADSPIEPLPELRTPKISERALISVPPFQVVGHIHLLPERDLRDALEELTGRFIPVTDAEFWSDRLGEARTSAPMVAVNHARAQFLTPYRELDPWAGIDRTAVAGGAAAVAGAAVGEVTDSDGPDRAQEPPWPEKDLIG